MSLALLKSNLLYIVVAYWAVSLDVDIHSLTTPYCTIIAWEEPHSASIFAECLSC